MRLVGRQVEKERRVLVTVDECDGALREAGGQLLLFGSGHLRVDHLVAFDQRSGG
jgi:hypothetical protein